MTAIDQLLALQTAPDRYDIAPADVQQLQIDAVNERFAERVDQIPLLRNRAQAAEITKVAQREDLDVPPWVLLLPLDEPGENIVDTSAGPVQVRGAFFDLSLDGRWGGVISGDRIDVDFGACDCGHQGPTIGPDITRYADLGGDKIACSGTIDAYVGG
ncbi:hypothetical protein [Mycolicibacterium lutetiense]|uniref:Uncharacterized protein n=1 Tax=Mycolicibacterium lutetiense TaxID=1641992 RepID=A0ABS4ZW45_9MYCO|nr:hypothetical protein [Mycolicibacterium lutetiense]MBP2452829.1 hypothetical protein [Mycolicibacterium lutetiense]